jgi:shikimate kinase
VAIIILLGLRGAGKSAVGRELGRTLGWPCLDLDRAIVERAGKPIARIFAEDGEPRFRDLEAAALARALAAPPGDVVLAPGGGVVLREENRRAIRDSRATVVYLAARPETLAARVETDLATGRPALVPGGALAEARALLLAREGFYRELATRVVETDTLSVPDVAARVRADM